MSPEEASFNKDQFMSENDQGLEIENISGSPDALSENHVDGEGERGRGDSPYSSSPSLGNAMDIPSPLLLQLSEDTSESGVDNTQHVNASNPEPSPAPITISAPPTNQLFPSLVEAVQQDQNFVTVDQADGFNFGYQNQSMMPPTTFNPDNSFPLDTMNNQDITFPLHDPANNGFGYTPFEFQSPNWPPELLDSAGRLQLPPFNHLSNSQLGAQIEAGIQNNGSYFVDGTTNWMNMHDPTFGSQEIQFEEGLDGGINGQGSFYLGGSTPNQLQFPNLPNNPDGNHGGNFVNNNLLDIGQSSSMIGMNKQNGMPLAAELQQPGLYNQDGNYMSNMQNTRRFMRNSVYDPIYEAMGLPLDPHLRIFLSRRDHDGLEKEGGKTNNASKST